MYALSHSVLVIKDIQVYYTTMAILELPVEDDVSQWGEAAPPKFEDEEMDRKAFQLWREGSLPESVEEN